MNYILKDSCLELTYIWIWTVNFICKKASTALLTLLMCLYGLAIEVTRMSHTCRISLNSQVKILLIILRVINHINIAYPSICCIFVVGYHPKLLRPCTWAWADEVIFSNLNFYRHFVQIASWGCKMDAFALSSTSSNT